MVNYMKAHFYRIMHKKSLYIYFSALLAGFIFVAAMSLSGNPASAEDAVSGANTFFSLSPLFFGGFIFAMIYNDELSAKSLPSAIGFGLGRIKIVISKLIVTIILAAVCILLMWAVFVIIFAVFGAKFSGENLFTLFKMLALPFLLTLIYSVIASIAAFGTQKGTIAISIYFSFSTMIVYQIVSLLLMIPKIKEIFGDLSKYVLENIVGEINKGLVGEWVTNYETVEQGGVTIAKAVSTTLVKGEITAEPYILFAVFFAVMLFLSGLAFKKKELEF